MDTPVPSAASPPPPFQQLSEDKLLWVLATGHYLLGGVTMMLGVIFLLMPYVTTFVPGAGESAWSFEAVCGAGFLVAMVTGILTLMCGSRLMAWEGLKFCRRVAAMESVFFILICALAFASIGAFTVVFIPFGLALGFGTSLVLRRPRIRARFRS